MAEGEGLIEAARRANRILQVGHLERFNAAVQAVQPILTVPRFIESARLAPFKHRGTDVDVVLDLMIHDIDLILSIVRSPVVSVDAIGSSVFSNEIDIANARLRFANGCVANATASRVSLKTERRLRLFQDDAYISIDLQQKVLTVIRKAAGSTADGMPQVAIEETSYEQGDALKAEIEAFLERCRDRAAAGGERRGRPVGAAHRGEHRRAGRKFPEPLTGFGDRLARTLGLRAGGRRARRRARLRGLGRGSGRGRCGGRLPARDTPRGITLNRHAIDEVARVREASGRYARMLGVMQLHTLTDRFVELRAHGGIADAEQPNLRRYAGDHVLRQLAFLGFAEPSSARELLQHARAFAIGVRPREREPRPEGRAADDEDHQYHDDAHPTGTATTPRGAWNVNSRHGRPALVIAVAPKAAPNPF